MTLVTSSVLETKLPLIRAALVGKVRQMLLMERKGVDAEEFSKKVKMAIAMYDYLNNYVPGGEELVAEISEFPAEIDITGNIGGLSSSLTNVRVTATDKNGEIADVTLDPSTQNNAARTAAIVAGISGYTVTGTYPTITVAPPAYDRTYDGPIRIVAENNISFLSSLSMSNTVRAVVFVPSAESYNGIDTHYVAVNGTSGAESGLLVIRVVQNGAITESKYFNTAGVGFDVTASASAKPAMVWSSVLGKLVLYCEGDSSLVFIVQLTHTALRTWIFASTYVDVINGVNFNGCYNGTLQECHFTGHGYFVKVSSGGIVTSFSSLSTYALGARFMNSNASKTIIIISATATIAEWVISGSPTTHILTFSPASDFGVYGGNYYIGNASTKRVRIVNSSFAVIDTIDFTSYTSNDVISVYVIEDILLVKTSSNLIFYDLVNEVVLSSITNAGSYPIYPAGLFSNDTARMAYNNVLANIIANTDAGNNVSGGVIFSGQSQVLNDEDDNCDTDANMNSILEELMSWLSIGNCTTNSSSSDVLSSGRYLSIGTLFLSTAAGALITI